MLLLFITDEEMPSEGPAHPHEAGGSLKANQDTNRRINSICKLEKKLKFRIMNVPEQEPGIVQGGT